MLALIPLLALVAPSLARPTNSTKSCRSRGDWAQHGNWTQHHASPHHHHGGTSGGSASDSVSSPTASFTSAISSSTEPPTSTPVDGGALVVSATSISSSVSYSSEESTSSSIISVEVVKTSTSSSSAPPAQSSPPEAGSVSSDADKDTYLKLHNDFRAKYGADAVTWDSTLAAYAAQAAGTCKFEHTHGPHGENLAAGSGDNQITGGFNGWAAEASAYNYSKPGFTEPTGHFTQVVWKGTTKIGCASAKCPAGSIFEAKYGVATYVVCEYDPAGNIVGNNGQYFTDNVGTLVA